METVAIYIALWNEDGIFQTSAEHTWKNNWITTNEKERKKPRETIEKNTWQKERKDRENEQHTIECQKIDDGIVEISSTFTYVNKEKRFNIHHLK
jgi:hypothetical protein